ncbi:MAG: ABC transporter ATP-binding protein [Candidatus Thermoplasmatota archaeon]|jgi:ABC-type multidrug transport system ATPase subunit|nr:ABC transporter ATP-binding protein [Candidatus Thermoplasmatota archaeon]
MGNVIEVSRISKSYGLISRKSILKDISFHIEQGECICIMGANGQGKSTLIKILAGLLARDRGEIKIAGRLGYMPETSINFPSLNIYQTMEYYGLISGYGKDYEQLIDRFSLAEKRKIVKKFSKGMKRKLDLIRALNLKPDLLLLDEPFEGLDPGVCNDMISVIAEEKARGSAILMSSHDMSYVEKIADRVFILKNGHLSQIDEWQRETTVLTVSGDLKIIEGIIERFKCKIGKDGEYLKIKVVGKEETISVIQTLAKNGVNIIKQEVVSLEDIFLQET